MTRLRQLGFNAQSAMNTVGKQKAEPVFFTEPASVADITCLEEFGATIFIILFFIK